MSDSHGVDTQAIQKQVRGYMLVFGTLAFLTVVTVLASYLDVAIATAVAIALAIAAVKGSLVALFFMHLSHEKRAIYWVLLLTATFFLLLMFLPLGTFADHTGSDSAVSTGAATPAHGGPEDTH